MFVSSHKYKYHYLECNHHKSRTVQLAGTYQYYSPSTGTLLVRDSGMLSTVIRIDSGLDSVFVLAQVQKKVLLLVLVASTSTKYNYAILSGPFRVVEYRYIVDTR